MLTSLSDDNVLLMDYFCFLLHFGLILFVAHQVKRRMENLINSCLLVQTLMFLGKNPGFCLGPEDTDIFS